MLEIRPPTRDEIMDVIETVRKGSELEGDRELWIWKNFLE